MSHEKRSVAQIFPWLVCVVDRVSVRSQGTARAALQTIRSADIVWADVILLMDDKHPQRVLADFLGE
ncbi:hypothetical protein SH528x_002690 [Novipirellula sp. SH528]|uniref:hypothetical protein n=1 Tax=Novipirellula sp. SH528 TaxID=3454466 RepID=UPI003FA183EF